MELPIGLVICFGMCQTFFAKRSKVSDLSLFIRLDMYDIQYEIQYETSFVEEILENSPDILSKS